MKYVSSCGSKKIQKPENKNDLVFESAIDGIENAKELEDPKCKTISLLDKLLFCSL